MSDLNNQIDITEFNTILNQVQVAHANGRISNEQYSNIIETFKNILNLVINNPSVQSVTSGGSLVPTNEIPLSGGFLTQLMSGGSLENNNDTSDSTLNYNENDTIDHEISLKGGYDYLYNPSKKNKFTPTASYHAKKSFANTNTALSKQIKQESESLTGGALNNYFNKLIESTLKNKKIKGGDFDDEFNGGYDNDDVFSGGAKKRKTCKKKKCMKGGEEESDEESDEEFDEKSDKKSDEEFDEKSDKKSDEESDEEFDEKSDEESDEEFDEEFDEKSDEEFIKGGKSQLQPYHDKIVENITNYLNKYEPDLEGESKELKGKQIKKLLNVLYYKSDENTSMEDRIKQLEDIGDKTSTEAKLKKIITSNQDELQSIIDSWVKAEPKKNNKKKNNKKKNKKPKKFNNNIEESIEIKKNKNKKETTESTTESSINGNIIGSASMIDSVIMGGKKKSFKYNNIDTDLKDDSILIDNKSFESNNIDTDTMIDSVIMGGRKKSLLKRNLFNY